MKRLLILDSGAFSVWNKGATIDLDGYIIFCQKYPDVSYYVSLDVIPGILNKKVSLRNKSVIEDCCRRGWDNYRRMIKELPKSKVIPVFHQNDHVKWLDKYLSFGVPYIGISPANDNTTKVKINWMDPKPDLFSGSDKAIANLKKILFDSTGRPVVKTHGFAVTSFRLMNLWEWHSVDSASWKIAAALGNIYIPQRSGNKKYDYSLPPMVVGMSPMSPHLRKCHTQLHINHLSGGTLKRVTDYLEEIGAKLGGYKVIKVKSSHQLKKAQEFWYNKKNLEVMQTVEKGLITHWELRALVNARFIREVMRQKAVSVKHIYFAGAPRQEIEPYLGKRLLTYNDMKTKGKDSKCLQTLNIHLESIRRGEKW
jgi:hypothetical protein